MSTYLAGEGNLNGIKLSATELVLVKAIHEHVYPEPKAGRVLPIESGEMRAAKSMQRKGLMTVSRDSMNRDQMAFTELGQRVYDAYRASLATGARTPQANHKEARV